jgi:hypothetical protein
VQGAPLHPAAIRSTLDAATYRESTLDRHLEVEGERRAPGADRSGRGPRDAAEAGAAPPSSPFADDYQARMAYQILQALEAGRNPSGRN